VKREQKRGKGETQCHHLEDMAKTSCSEGLHTVSWRGGAVIGHDQQKWKTGVAVGGSKIDTPKFVEDEAGKDSELLYKKRSNGETERHWCIIRKPCLG